MQTPRLHCLYCIRVSFFTCATGKLSILPFFSRETRETHEKCIPQACHLRTQRPHGRPSSRRQESHAFRRRPSGRPCASLRAAQAPGCPDGLVHAGEGAGRVADGGMPRARRTKGISLSSRRWPGIRPCEARWLHPAWILRVSRVSREKIPGSRTPPADCEIWKTHPKTVYNSRFRLDTNRKSGQRKVI